jgi:outer membrane protein TolC
VDCSYLTYETGSLLSGNPTDRSRWIVHTPPISGSHSPHRQSPSSVRRAFPTFGWAKRATSYRLLPYGQYMRLKLTLMRLVRWSFTLAATGVCLLAVFVFPVLCQQSGPVASTGPTPGSSANNHATAVPEASSVAGRVELVSVSSLPIWSGLQPVAELKGRGSSRQPAAQQQPGTPAQPQVPGGTPAPSTPPSTATPQTAPQSQTPQIQPSQAQPSQSQTPQSPQQPAQPPAQQQQPGIAPPQGPPPPGRESVPTPAPDQLIPVPQIAPDYRSNNESLPELGRVGVDMMQQQPLTIREAIEMALKNNKDIEVARDNVRAAEFDLLGARGAYDPRFSSLSYYERSITPTASFLGGGPNGTITSSDVTATARLEGLVPKHGGSYRVDFSSVRSTTDNIFNAVNPQYPTSFTFNFTQPLSRGFRFDQNRRQIEVSKKNLSLTDSQFRQRTIETIANVQLAYWDLVFALRNLQIQRDAVRDARTQLEHNKRLVAEGMLAPIDIVSAQAQVSGYEGSVYTALEDVSKAENYLKNLIAENRQAQIWTVSIIPTDPVDLSAPTTSLPEAMNAAISNRPELQQSDVARQINEIDQRYFREQTKTQVDFTGTYGVVGLAGTQITGVNPLTASNNQLIRQVNLLSVAAGLPPIPVPPVQTINDALIGGYFQSLNNLAANRYNNFRVGVQIELPLHNRTAKAQLGRSLVEAQRIRTQREQLEEAVQVDVRNSLQVLRSAEARLRAAAAARSANEQQYSSEQRKFDAGQSTLFLVLQRQTELTTARGNELRAQTDLNKAIADLQRATGNSLRANNVIARVR